MDTKSHYTTMDVETIVTLMNEDKLDIDPPYQRGYVWSKNKQSGLIDSILLSLPIPSFMFAQTTLQTFTVIDGKQRIKALIDFKSDKVTVYVDGVDRKYSQLTDRQQARFDAAALAVTISTGLSLRDESILFERINRAAPLSQGEMMDSYTYSPFKQTVEDFTKQKHTIYMKLCECLVGDTNGRNKRKEKPANMSAYFAGAALGPDYITTSFKKLQPLLEWNEHQWNEKRELAYKNLETLSHLWDLIINVDKVDILPWIKKNQIWRLGFLNGHILFSIWTEDDMESTFEHWRTFIAEIAKSPITLKQWKGTYSGNAHNLTKYRLLEAWCQVKKFNGRKSFEPDANIDSDNVPQVRKRLRTRTVS